jgi:hypothetical protein
MAWGFREGVAEVYVGGTIRKWGYIDKSGSFIINPDFDDAGSFVDGLAKVRVNGKYGFIDLRGRRVIGLEFDDVLYNFFRGGLPRVKIGNKYNFIDRAGKIVSDQEFDDTRSFEDGLAPVKVGDLKTGRWGFIDTKGKSVIDPQYQWVKRFRTAD